MTARPEAFDPTPLASVLEAWDALVERWDLDQVERSWLLGSLGAAGVTDVAAYAPARAEERMRLLVRLGLVLDLVHGDVRRTRFWLRAPNRRLGQSSPIDVMATSTAWIRWMVDHVGLAA